MAVSPDEREEFVRERLEHARVCVERGMWMSARDLLSDASDALEALSELERARRAELTRVDELATPESKKRLRAALRKL